MALLQAKVEQGILEGLPAANQMFSVFRAPGGRAALA